MKPFWVFTFFLLIFVVMLFSAGCSCEDNNNDEDDESENVSDDDSGETDDDDNDDDSQADTTHPYLDLTSGEIRLPFPSGYFSLSDPNSPTTIRLSLNKELPESVQQVLNVSEDTDIIEAIADLDGFSILGPVLIPFSGALDLTPWSEESPGDFQDAGESFFRLFDITDTPPQPLDVWVSFIEGQNVLVLRPTKPLLAGHRILVCISGLLVDSAGEPVTRPALFNRVMQKDEDIPEDPLIDDLEDIRDLIESGAIGMAPEEVLLAFSYWTGTGLSVLHNIRKAVDQLNEQTPIIPEQVEYEDAQTITGSFLSPEFRSSIDIIDAVTSEDETPIQKMTQLNFLLRLPEQIDDPLAPVMHLHGLGGSRYSSPTLEEMAVFSIDAVLHGDRDEYTGDAPYPFLDFNNLRLFRDNIRQTVADHFALVRMIQNLAQDPTSFGLPDNLLAEGTLAVQGHSLGCLNGAPIASVDPQIDHLVCVGGGGFFSIFQKKSAYGLFMPAAIRGLPVHEGLIFGHLMQAAIDTADPAALAANLVVNTPDGRPPRNVLIMESVGDRSVPNMSTEAVAWSAGLNVNEGALSNWFGLTESTLPLTGNLQWNGEVATGLIYEFNINAAPFDKHGQLFSLPQQLEMAHTFLKTAAKTGVGTIIDPEADK